jgi:hypothetical protein
MKQEDKVFEITSSNITFTSAIEEVGLSQERINELKTKNIWAIPVKNYHGKEGFFFFGGAREFYMFCKEYTTNHDMDFCIEKTQYSEIDLNSIELFLGTFLITSIVVPIFVNLISDFIRRKLTHDSDEITVNIIINNISQNNSTNIHFKGTRDEFENKVLRTLSIYNKNGQIQLPNTDGTTVDVLS